MKALDYNEDFLKIRIFKSSRIQIWEKDKPLSLTYKGTASGTTGKKKNSYNYNVVV